MADKQEKKPDALTESLLKLVSLDEPQEMSAAETAADIAAGFVPGVGTAQAARDFERARRSDDKLGMALAGVGAIPVVGGVVKPAKSAVKPLLELVEKYTAKEAPKEQKMLMGVYRGYAGNPAEEATLFATPQKRVADYYAQKRAAQTGGEPHVERLLVDPFAGQQYGHSIPIDKFNREVVVTRARKLKPEDVKDRNKLYAEGGSVTDDAVRNWFQSNQGANDQTIAAAMRQHNVSPEQVARVTNVALPEVQQRYAAAQTAANADQLRGNPGKTLSDLASLYSVGTYFIPGLQAAPIADIILRGVSLGNTIKSIGRRLGFEEGGAVEFDPDEIAQIAERATQGFAAGGLVDYDPNEIDTIVSRVKEELHG